MGKSSIFLRYTENQFDYSYQPSTSVAIGNVVKKINIPYQGVVSVVIWDVPGREEMDLRKSYYKDVDAAIGNHVQTSMVNYLLTPSTHVCLEVPFSFALKARWLQATAC